MLGIGRLLTPRRPCTAIRTASVARSWRGWDLSVGEKTYSATPRVSGVTSVTGFLYLYAYISIFFTYVVTVQKNPSQPVTRHARLIVTDAVGSRLQTNADEPAAGPGPAAARRLPQFLLEARAEARHRERTRNVLAFCPLFINREERACRVTRHRLETTAFGNEIVQMVRSSS